MVAGDALVTPIGKVYDISTGKLLWTDKDNLIGSKYRFWRHGGKEHILTVSGVDGSTLKGYLRLIEPRTGDLLWEYPVFGQG
jgi:hypothetical protein